MENYTETLHNLTWQELLTQLSAILGYVDQLQELNTDNVEPLAHR